MTHQCDGNGLCTACHTPWPTKCQILKTAVWFAEATIENTTTTANGNNTTHHYHN